jgi:hypothetical protein
MPTNIIALNHESKRCDHGIAFLQNDQISSWTQEKFSPKCSRLKKDMQELQELWAQKGSSMITHDHNAI